MRSSVYNRAASFLICVAFLLSVTFVKPQKAEAVALTSTAVVASVAAIMTACGVTYWAHTQQDAIDYLGDKIDDYLATLSQNTITYEEWLGISGTERLFTVISNGVLSFGSSVANKILDFIRWFNTNEGIQSGGQIVGELGGPIQLTVIKNNIYGTQNISVDTFGSVIMTFDDQGGNLNSAGGVNYTNRLYIPTSSLPSSLNVKLSSMSLYRGSNRLSSILFSMGFVSSTSELTGASLSWSVNTVRTFNNTDNLSYFYIQVPTGWKNNLLDGTLKLEFEGATLVNPDTVVVNPSYSVSVPNSVAVGQTLDVTTNANIIQGASVEDATSAILDTVVTAGGLSSTNEVSGEAVPSESFWLWDAITSLPATIANEIKAVLLDVFIPDQAFIDDFFANLNSIFNNRFSILSFPFALLGTFITKVASMSSSEPIISWPNIYEHFSGKLLISAGSYNLNSILANQAIANMYAIYMIVIKAIISFQFVAFLYAWFCDVFHMRNSDFDNPYDLASGGDIDDS